MLALVPNAASDDVRMSPISRNLRPGSSPMAGTGPGNGGEDDEAAPAQEPISNVIGSYVGFAVADPSTTRDARVTAQIERAKHTQSFAWESGMTNTGHTHLASPMKSSRSIHTSGAAASPGREARRRALLGGGRRNRSRQAQPRLRPLTSAVRGNDLSQPMQLRGPGGLGSHGGTGTGSMSDLMGAGHAVDSHHTVFPKWLRRRNDFQSFFPGKTASQTPFPDSRDVPPSTVGGGGSPPQVVPERVLLDNALRLSPKDRTERDVALLVKFVRRVPALASRKLKPNTLKAICRKLAMLGAQFEGDQLFEIGDPCSVFFLLVEGAVELVDASGNIVEAFEAESPDAAGLANAGGSDGGSGKRTPGGNCPFIGFGEEALLDEAAESGFARQSTARVASTRARVLTLRSYDFRQCLKTVEENEILSKVKWLSRQVPLLDGWSHSRLHALATVASEQEVPAGTMVVRQGDETNCVIHVVFDGICAEHAELAYTSTNRWPESKPHAKGARGKGKKGKGKDKDKSGGRAEGTPKDNGSWRTIARTTVKPVRMRSLGEGAFFFCFGKYAPRSLVSETRATLLSFSERDTQHFFTRHPAMLKRAKELSPTMLMPEEEIRKRQAFQDSMHEKQAKFRHEAIGPLYYRRIQEAELEARVGTKL